MKALRANYIPGTVVQYRDGSFKVKSEEHGLIPKSRLIAMTSEKVINGGNDLQKGWRVCHLDMSSYGTDEHDDPSNLVVIKCREHKFEMLKTSRIVFEPKPKTKPIAILTRGLRLK